MKLNLGQKIKDFDGLAVQWPTGPIDGSTNQRQLEDVHLWRVFENSLMMDKTGATASDKIRNFQLAIRVHKQSGDVEFTIEELVLLKTLVNDLFTHPLIYGRVNELVEKASKGSTEI